MVTAALIAAAIGATASGVTSGIGASKAAKERKKSELLLKQREDEARADYIVDKNKKLFRYSRSKIFTKSISSKVEKFE